MYSALTVAAVLAASAVPREETIQDERVACAGPPEDLDGDGVPDLACITRRGDQEPQRVVVVLSSSPAQVALDVPILGCPRCGGSLGLSVEIEAVPGMLNVRERGGSREEWTRGVSLAYRAGTFHVVGESYTVLDRTSRAEVELGTSYEDGVARSHRILRPASGGETATAAWLDIYATAGGGESRDPPLSHPHILETVIDRADYVIEGDASWSNADDLSFVIRAESAGSEIRIGLDVKDDDVQVAGTADRPHGDRVELWWDRGGDPWTGSFEPKLAPNPKTTEGVSMELLPAGKVRMTRIFPGNRAQPGVLASWKRTSSGYALDIRAARHLFEGPADRFDREGSDTLANVTVIVRDVDAGKVREKAMGSSKLEHRGAPFEMGWLHLRRPEPAGQLRPGRARDR